MKKNILVKIGERTEEYSVIVPAEQDEEGNVLTEEHEEVRQRVVPVMEAQNVEMTEEEIAEMQENVPEYEPTPEERLNQLEQALTALIGGDTGE